MDSHASDWVHDPTTGLYYSPRNGYYARPNPYVPSGWEYIPFSNTTNATQSTGVATGSANAHSHINGGEGQNTDSEARHEETGEGGIGNVGWALDIVLPGEEKDQSKDTSTAKPAAVNQTGNSNSSSFPNGSGATLSSAPITSTISSTIPLAAQKAPPTLRLLVQPSTSSPLPPEQKKLLLPPQAITPLPSAPSGIFFGRDKDASRSVLRLREMGVSKRHAVVWFGRGGEFEEEFGRSGDGGRRWGERKFWVADCGSTHGTFLKPSLSSGSAKRLSSPKNPSDPFPLAHMDTITIGTTIFQIHLHEEWPCLECVVNEPQEEIQVDWSDAHRTGAGGKGKSVYASSATVSASASSTTDSTGKHNDWKSTESRRIALTAEAKRAETQRRSALAMKNLKASYFGGGAGKGGGTGKSTGKDEEGKEQGRGKRKFEMDRDEGWKRKRGEVE